ncbi:MAG: hypothetical protein U0359_33385 [Byssovorax sp.]
MHEIVFNRLPQAVRARFIDVIRRPRQAPILAEHEEPVLTYYGVGAGLVLSWVGMGYGAATTGWAGALVLGASLFVFSAALATGILAFARRQPWRRGTYLLPGYIVVAGDGEALRIVPWSRVVHAGLVEVRIRRRGIVDTSGRFELRDAGGTTHHFPFESLEQARQAFANAQAVQAQFAQAYTAGDRATLGRLDLFYECTTTGQWAEPAQAPQAPPRAHSRPVWARALPWLVGLGVALPVVLVRGLVSTEGAPDSKPVQVASSNPKEELDRYRPRAGSPAALAFIEGALNAAGPKKRICLVTTDPSDDELAALDRDLTKLHASDGKLFKGLGKRDYYGSYRFDDDTPLALDGALATAFGGRSLPVERGRASDVASCPAVLVRVQLRASPTRVVFHKESMIRGAFGVKFSVSTQLPGKPEQPAFDLDVPAPDAAALVQKADADASAGTGRGYADEIYFANLRLAWAALKTRLNAHFVKSP